MYSKAQLNSFAKLDTSRVVNTPRSVLACELEGIDPTELIARGSQSPRRRYPVGSKEDQKQRLEEEFEEREYQKLLAVAKKRWSQLSSSRIGSAKSTAHVSTTKTTPRGDNTAISSESKRWVAGIDKEVASAAAQVIEADVTVAKRFLQLKNNVEDAAKARADLEERELAAQERYDALMASRKLHAIEQGKKFEARQLKVVSSQSSQLEDRKQRLEARLATLQERLEAADRNVAEMKVTRSKGAVKKGGEEERLAVEIAQREKAEALERKLSAANHTAMERRAMKAVADELNQFQRDLKQRAMEKAQERAAKVQAYRQLQIREREIEDAEQDAQRSVERHREAKVRHAAREVIALQLEEVKRHVEMYTSVGNSDISTPDWLAPRLNQVQATTPKKLPTRVPQPPPPKSETARQRELKQATREKFSISSPRVSERQVYANWMYE